MWIFNLGSVRFFHCLPSFHLESRYSLYTVPYTDYDQDPVFHSYPLTADVRQMQIGVGKMYAHGGGDGPEAVEYDFPSHCLFNPHH